MAGLLHCGRGGQERGQGAGLSTVRGRSGLGWTAWAPTRGGPPPPLHKSGGRRCSAAGALLEASGSQRPFPRCCQFHAAAACPAPSAPARVSAGGDPGNGAGGLGTWREGVSNPISALSGDAGRELG